MPNRLPPRQKKRAASKKNRKSSQQSFGLLAGTIAAVLLLSAIVFLLTRRGGVAQSLGDSNEHRVLRQIQDENHPLITNPSPFVAGWKLLHPKESDFNVLVPVATKEISHRSASNSMKGSIESTMYQGSNVFATVNVTEANFSGLTALSLINSVKNWETQTEQLAKTGGKVLSDKMIAHAGASARRITATMESKYGHAYIESLTISKFGKIFEVAVIQWDSERADWTDQFFASITFNGRSAADLPDDFNAWQGKSVDLIAPLDDFKPGLTGDWTIENEELVVDDSAGSVVLPLVPNERYQIQLEVKKEGGTSSFGIGFPIRDRQCLFSIDGYDGDRTGLSLLDGKTQLEQPAADTQFGTLIGRGWNSVSATVLPKGDQVNIIGAVNDEVVLDWTGDFDRLSLNRQYWKPPLGTLFLVSWQSPLRFRNIRFTDLSSDSSD